MTNTEWEYVGDADIKQGGFFFKYIPEKNHARVVEVTSYFDMGGPSNLFYIGEGKVLVPEIGTKTYASLIRAGGEVGLTGHYVVCKTCNRDGKWSSEFECRMIIASKQTGLGLCEEDHEWVYSTHGAINHGVLVALAIQHIGFSHDYKREVVRVGPSIKKEGEWSLVKPDHILRSKANFRKFVRKTYLD